MTVLANQTKATPTVMRVRFRSTICVPPCDVGVKPRPPIPPSRGECIRIKAIKTTLKVICRKPQAQITPLGAAAAITVEDVLMSVLAAAITAVEDTSARPG